MKAKSLFKVKWDLGVSDRDPVLIAADSAHAALLAARVMLEKEHPGQVVEIVGVERVAVCIWIADH